MILLIFLTWSLSGRAMAHPLHVQGHVGGEVLIRCSHMNARNNIKYFCNESCSGENIFIRSQVHQTPSVRDRYSIFDEGTGTFIVTISNLKLTDSGRYWCGVERRGWDTYIDVFLTVSDAPASSSSPTADPPDLILSTEKMRTTKTQTVTTEPGTTTTSAHEPDTGEMSLIYIGVGLATLVVFLVIFLLILLKLKRANRKHSVTSSQADPIFNLNSPTKPSCSANQMLLYPEQQQESPSSQDPSSIYCNITSAAAADTQDSLHYASVSFTRQACDPKLPASVSETGSGFAAKERGGTPARSSECLYSNITASHRPSSTEDLNTAVYSTVKKNNLSQE